MAFTPGTGAVISFSVEGAQSAQRQIQSIGDTMQNLATNAKASLKELAAFAGFGLSVGAVAEQMLSAQREFDKLNAALVTATGSTADAAAAFKSLQAFAASTPYSVADATEAFIKMKNLGLDPSEKALRSYGNTAAAMGKGLDQMIEAVADAATGEFERLKEFGITSKQSGDKVALTFKGITTTIGKNADEIQAYLKKLGDTDFAGAMALRADTLDGAISNLGDAWDAFMLKMSQSGVGDAAKNGVVMLADNLQLLAGVIGTVAAAKLGSTFAAWATDTYKQVAASVALRVATVAEMESAVAGSAAKVAQLQATQATIVVAREEAMAKLASSNANIVAAETAIAAAEAAGAQSFALRTLRLATAELTVAETARAAALAELSVLGTQQASVSAKVTAARLAEKAAQDALNASTATGTLATGVASRALGLLGGPIGAIITVLGLAATAWSVWGNAAKEGSKQATESYEDAHKRIVKGLDEQIAKNQKLVQLQNLGLTKPQIDRNQPVLEQLAAASKRLNDINNQTGDYAPGKGKDSADFILDRTQVLKDIVVLNEKMKKSDESAAAAATGSTEAMIALRQRLTGVNQQYLDDLEKLQAAREKGEISQQEYTANLLTLAKETFANSAMGKLYAQSLDAQAAAIQRVAEAQGLRNERDQAHIQFLKSTGQADDEATIRAAAAAQIKALNDQISSQQNLMAVESRRQVSAEQLAQKQADSDGKVASLRIQIGNVKAKREEDLFALEQQRYRTAVNNTADLIEKEQAELVSLKQQTQAQIDQNDQIGLTTKQIAALTAMRLEEAAARKDGDAIVAEGLDLTGERAERIRDEARAIRERATAVVDGATKQEIYDKNLQDLNAMVDIMSALDSAAQSAAQGMANAFGSVGSAIGGMTTALSGYERTQAAIAAQLASATKDAHGDQTKIQRANMMAAEASAQAQIKSFGDMGAAAKGFFKENTAGYRAMEGVEKTFRAFEMAMALSNMAQKLGLVGTYTAAVVAGKQAETQAAIASVGPEVAAAQAKGTANAAAGVANQAGGDPYTAWPRMAAMAAVMVGLGFAVSGGGSSVSLSQQRQAAQGAGSVLGDSDAKSESIKKSIDLVEKNTYQDLAISSSMLATLRSIDTNISRFAGQLVRSTDITNPDVGTLNSNNGLGKTIASWGAGGVVFGSLLAKIPALGNIFGKVGTSIFGGKQSVEDSGFSMDATSLATILGSGAKAFQYADIKTSGGWLGRDKLSEQTTPLSEAANQQFTAIIKSLADSVKTAGDLLGLSGDDFTKKLNSFIVDIGEVSLKGLKGDDLQKAVESVFAKLGDDMAQFAVGGLSKFQQVGEGYLETLTRLAAEYQTVDVVFQSFGKTFGAIGMASIEARDQLVQLAGGLDKFTSQGEYFLTNFFSDQEQAAALRKRIDPMLAQYGLSSEGENAAKAFRDFVVSLDTTTAAGAQAYATLMTIAPALKSVVDAEKSALDERKSLQDKLDELTMTSTQLHEKERAVIDASNLALYDRITALQAEKDAASNALSDVDSAFSVLQKVVAREKEAVQASVDAHTASVSKLQSLSQSLRSTLDSMKSPDQQVLARAAAQAQIRTVLANVKAGGTLPEADALKDALSVLAKNSTDQFAAYPDYLRDLYQTQNDIAQLGDITDDQLSVEQKALQAAQSQLNRLDAIVANGQAQIDAINGQSVATLTLAQAMAGLQTSLSSAQATPYVTATSGISQAYMQLLGRAPDAAGLAYWQQAAASGMSLSQIRALIEDSAEYKNLKGVPGFATGGDFGGGWRVVGENGPELEATGPARIFNAGQTSDLFARLASPSSNNDALLAEVKTLRVAIERLEQRNSAENVAQVKQLQATVDLLTRVIYGGESIQTKVAS